MISARLFTAGSLLNQYNKIPMGVGVSGNFHVQRNCNFVMHGRRLKGDVIIWYSERDGTARALLSHFFARDAKYN